jgi:hypothetical protein
LIIVYAFLLSAARLSFYTIQLADANFCWPVTTVRYALGCFVAVDDYYSAYGSYVIQ